MSRIAFAAAVLTVVASVTGASAATLTDSDSFGPALTEFASTADAAVNPLGTPVTPGATLMLDQFDASLGTLTGVEVMLEGSFVSLGDVENTSPNSVLAQVTNSGTFFFSSTAFAAPTITASDSTGFVTFAPGVNVGAGNLSGSDMATVTPGDFTPFIGSGTFDIDFATFIDTSFGGGGGNLLFNVDTNGEVSASVTYTYDEPVTPPSPVIPLPAAGWLLIAGLGGLAVVGRRKST